MEGNSPKLGRKTSLTFEVYRSREKTAVFEMFYAAFQDARENTGGASDFHIEIAGHVILLKFAGDALVSKITKALDHLKTGENQAPDLTINLWDSVSTKRPLPLLLETITELMPNAAWTKKLGRREEVYPLSNERFLSSLQWGSEIFTVLDKEKNKCVYWIKSVEKLPYFEIGAPLRSILHWWFSSPTSQLVHGGAVGDENGGVLLAGEGGSGKSTTALNCLRDGLFYASDDYVLVDIEKQPMAFSLFQTAKVKTAEDIARFPEFASWVTNSSGVLDSEEKPMIFVNENKPEQMARKLPINAIVFPKFVSGKVCSFEKIPEQEAFRGLAPSSINQTPFAGAECVKMLGDLVRKLPAYSLTFGENQKDISDIVRQIIKANR